LGFRAGSGRVGDDAVAKRRGWGEDAVVGDEVAAAVSEPTDAPTRWPAQVVDGMH